MADVLPPTIMSRRGGGAGGKPPPKRGGSPGKGHYGSGRSRRERWNAKIELLGIHQRRVSSIHSFFRFASDEM